MVKIEEASFVACMNTGSWKTMTERELRKSAEELSELLEEALEEMEDAGVRRRFLRGVRNRLKLSMVSVREDDGGGKK